MATSPDKRAMQGLPREAREAIKAVFEALSDWRDEVGSTTERHGEMVLDKMAAAARALGWPKELVDASHKHLTQASKAQMHLIEQLMQAWEKQLTSPTSDQFMIQLRTLPTMGLGATPSTPLEFWMQAAEMWQRNWELALSMWTSGSSRPH